MDKTIDMSKLKRGYLNGDFEFFHIKDKKNIEFEFHYHEFNKIIIFISGDVTYLIEGKAYKLKPWDVLFINSNDIHKPVINPDSIYERIVIWVNSKFLNIHNKDNSDLSTCFELSSKQKSSLLRINPDDQKHIKSTLTALEEASKSLGFGNTILKNSLFLQLMVYLNRLILGTGINVVSSDIKYDQRIGDIISHINSCLADDLSVECISSRFYINKYYLMHSFKEQTGYTLHNYIQQKRLAKAASMIKSGMQAMDVCVECGFGDYSSFVRAFKKNFALSPKQYYKAVKELDEAYKNNEHILF